MTFAVIVQARMGSSRLPGKVLEPIGAKSALARCLERCQDIPGVDAVVVAIPHSSVNDPIEAEALRLGCCVSRGPEDDVLARYAIAARSVHADVVMRVTSDCPLIDPQVCGQVRDLLDTEDAEYVCNNMPAKYPHGLDCDAFAAARLYDADWLARTPYEREHVTPWLRTREEIRKACHVGPGQGLERLRWTLDHPDDLKFFQELFDVMGEKAARASWSEIAAVCLRRPDLVAINAAHVDETRLAAEQTADVETAPARFAA
jgi:spore coat polysaccharide biosynthesis protein SpsF (cytidylyltransferase family)